MQGWRVCTLRTMIVMVLLVAAAVVSAHGHGGLLVAQAQQAAGQSFSQDAMQLRGELAERLLSQSLPAPPGPAPPGVGSTLQLLPGQLPSDLALDLPLPEGARLLGSAVRGIGPIPPSTEVVLDVPGSAAEVLTFYERAFQAQRWTASPVGAPLSRGGFQTVLSSTYCRGPNGPSLTLTILSQPSGLNDVRLRLQPPPGNPCSAPATPAARPPTSPQGADLLPKLVPPAGVALQFTAPVGPSARSSEAIAETDRSAAELEALFGQQLQASGWTRLAGQADRPLAWSTWRLPGEGDWQGLLIVLEWPAQSRQALYVRVESPTAQAAGPGMLPAPPVPPSPVGESTR
jgi:hypothetical protein